MAKNYKVAVKEYEKQFAERVIAKDAFIELEVTPELTLFLRPIYGLPRESPIRQKFEEIQGRVMELVAEEQEAARGGGDMPDPDGERIRVLQVEHLVNVMSEDPDGRDPYDLIEQWLETGRTEGDLFQQWQTINQGLADEAGNFRYRKSGS